MNRVLVVRSTNESPEAEINERLEEEFKDWRVVSATTVMVPWGEQETMLHVHTAMHMFMVTTVILEKD